jgi:predicted ArsR family transcriptional regulator
MTQLDAIADPVRLAVLRHLADHGPASARELADAAGVHVNTIRGHLQEMERAGLLATEPRPAEGPGRPGVDYRLGDSAAVGAGDFRRLAELLTTTLARLPDTEEQLRRTGEDWGRYLIGRPGAYDARERLPAVLAELGFRAEVLPDEVRLSGCPCPLISPDRPELICRLAAGAVAGALAAADARQAVGSEEHDPGARRCTIGLVRV